MIFSYAIDRKVIAHHNQFARCHEPLVEGCKPLRLISISFGFEHYLYYYYLLQLLLSDEAIANVMFDHYF
jgi:hypothetical protein